MKLNGEEIKQNMVIHIPSGLDFKGLDVLVKNVEKTKISCVLYDDNFEYNPEVELGINYLNMIKARIVSFSKYTQKYELFLYDTL